MMNHLKWCQISAVFTLLCVTELYSQSQSLALHEIAPFIGFYAPDRYETSAAFGVRYYYDLDKRFGVGGILGFAKAKQDFLRQANGINLQPGSERVFYNGARATYSFPTGTAEPYLVFHLGLTRLYGENNFTYGFGVGTKVRFKSRFSLRYEFLNYIFSSGRDTNEWTNKNIEVALALGYYL
jgi:hypothetical protein